MKSGASPRSIAWLSAALCCWLAGTSHGQPAGGTTPPSPVARLFGANIGDAAAQVQAAGKAAGWQCSQAKDALVCLQRDDVATQTTYWLRDGRVSRMYQVAQVQGQELNLYDSAYQTLRRRAQDALGRAPDEIQPLPTWLARIRPEQQYAWFIDHHLSQSVAWHFGGVRVSVWQRSERDAPVVFLAAEAFQDCSDKALAAALLELHPPASAERRAASARLVADCAGNRGAGALAAALAKDPEPTVRAEVVRSLGKVASPVAREALASAAREDKSPEVQKESLRALVRVDAGEVARSIAADKHQPANLRKLADEVLAETKKPEKPVPATAPAVAAPTPAPAPAAAPTLAPAAVVASSQPAPATKSGTEKPARESKSATRAARAKAERRSVASSKEKSAPAKPAVATAAAAPVSSVPAAAPAPAKNLLAATLSTPSKPVAVAAPAAPAATPPVAAAPPPTAIPPVAPAAVPALSPVEAPPEKPKAPSDGTVLAIVTSAAAGGLWGGSLSLLAQQNNPGVVALVGGAGAVIGGGTAWGITRFGLRPTPAQSFFFANSTAWGSLAGLMAWSGSGSDSPKLKYGLLVGGETAGLSMGILGARLWKWTPGQILTANSLLLGAGLAGLGTNRLIYTELPASVSPYVGYGLAPAMVGSALAARYLDLTGNDLRMMGVGSLAAGWTGSLIASGATGTSLLGGHQGQGGALIGLGVGYLSMAALSPFVETNTRTLVIATGGLAAGNLLGLGTAMLAEPNGPHWALGAGLGGVGYALGAVALAPHLRLGPDWPGTMTAGLAYGAGTWLLASAASYTDSTPRARVVGGALAGGVAGGTVGLIASEFIKPDAADYGTAAAAAAAGMSAGLGVARLTTADKGTPDMIGVLAGSAVGFAGGATFAHYSQLRPPSLLAGGLGSAFGLFAGTLAPTLGDANWSASRRTFGGSWLGAGVGAAGGTALARWLDAGYKQDVVALTGGTLGLGMGFGAGLMLSEANLRPARIGAVAAPAVLAGGALLLDRSLHLSDSLGLSALPVVGMGAGVGMLEGGLLADVVAVRDSNSRTRQLEGGVLLGASAGVAGGLVLSKFVQPRGRDYVGLGAATMLGLSLGQGIGRLAVTPEKQGDFLPSLRLAGSLTGFAGGAWAMHSLDWRWTDNLAGLYGSGFGGLVGAFVPSVLVPSLRETDDDRFLSGGASTGMAVGGLAAAAAAHATGASASQVNFAAAATTLGLGTGLGLGMAWPDDSSQPERIGLVAGSLGFVASALALDYKLHLSSGEGLTEPGYMALAGAVVGGAEGALLAGAMDPSGLVGSTPRTRLAGGVLFGTSLGASSGFLLSRFTRPAENEFLPAMLGSALGGTLGFGVSMLAVEQAGRSDTLAAMGGSLGALAGAAAVAHVGQLKLDAPALLTGAAYGGLVGALAPTLADQSWPGWTRKSTGGLLAGGAGGALTGSVIVAATHASPKQTGVAALGGLDGLLMGLGLGMALPNASSQPERIGLVAGSLGFMASAVAFDYKLHLSSGEGLTEPGYMTLAGALVGGVQGALLAGAMDPSGLPGKTPADRLGGGILFGTSLGATSGFLLSRFSQPAQSEFVPALLGSALGGSLGLGVSMLAVEQAGRSDTLDAMGGSLGALAGAAALAHVGQLHLDAPALLTGAAYGGLVGALAPSLADETWPGWTRRNIGGLLAGGAGGALTGSAIAAATHASPTQTGVAALGGLDGLLMGLGLGMALPNDSSQPERIGMVAGSLGFMATTVALDYKLHLSSGEGLTEPVYMTLAGAAVGGVQGALLAGAMDPSGLMGKTPADRLGGGILFGTSLGATSGLLLSRFTRPAQNEFIPALLDSALGGTLGLGVSMLAVEQAGRSDTLAAMGGSLGALAGAAVAAHVGQLKLDAPALLTGLAYGGMVGVLAPSLSDETWPGWTRKSTGGLLAGGAGGALTASAIVAATGATPSHTLGTALAGLDGLLAGVGYGLLFDDQDTRGARIGSVAGAAAGLAAGAALWPRLRFDEPALELIGTMTALGVWNGAWLPALGHTSWGDISARQQWGGALAGGATASLVATGLASYLTVDTDLIVNAVTMNALLAGAGAGAGAMVSERFDAPVAGMLGGGLAGLLLGGALHNSINIEADNAPWLVLAPLEGLWLGAWLPRAIYSSDEMTTRRQVGGLVAGGLGAAGLATLTSRWVKPTGTEAGIVGGTSIIGAALAGGSVLLADNLHDQRGVGIMLGGTAAGLGVGMALAPRLSLDLELGGYVSGGALLGASEGLVFAWAGRGTTSSDYAGASLVGAGLGAALGLTHGLGSSQAVSRKLAAGGFAAWGAWVGAFGGALANRDPHEVTLGGLAAANVGAAIGYGLVAYDWVEPRDFGWLSLFGAAGAVLGGGTGAIFSSASDPRPVLAGLTIGPAVGITVGAFVLPRLHSLTRSDSPVSYFNFGRRQVAGMSWQLSDATEPDATSADVLAGRSGPGLLRRAAHHLGEAFEITQWTPFVSALPATPGDPTGSSPFVFGVSGFWK